RAVVARSNETDAETPAGKEPPEGPHEAHGSDDTPVGRTRPRYPRVGGAHAAGVRNRCARMSAVRGADDRPGNDRRPGGNRGVVTRLGLPSDGGEMLPARAPPPEA